MALTYTEYTLGSATVNGIDIGTDEIILEANLSPFDAGHLEAALDAIEADLEEETTLADYTMPNGQTADVYFAQFVRDEATLVRQYTARQIKNGVASAIADNADAIADNADAIAANATAIAANATAIAATDQYIADNEASWVNVG